MRKGILRLLLFVLLISIFSCKKNDSNPVASRYKIDFRVHYTIDGNLLLKDTLIYTNDAGNKYSVSRLEYYISAIKLLKQDGAFESEDVHYVNFNKEATNSFSLENIPAGNYTGISLILGLDSVHNITNALPPTQENNAMAWPDMMGGGYHFMKLEGYFMDIDPNAPENGYAIHLGRNANIVKINKQINFNVESNKTLNLTMNINEWFRNPNKYDFNTDGNYSMNNKAALAKLAANGTDVFSFSFE